MNILKYNGLGMLIVVKPLRILLFIVVWNILCGLGILLNGGSGPVKTLGGYLGFAMAGAFAACSGLAPVVNLGVRERWCRQDVDFEQGRFGLVMLALIGCTFTLVGFGSIVLHLGRFRLPEAIVATGFPVLIAAVMILSLVFGINRKKDRTTKESMRRGPRAYDS